MVKIVWMRVMMYIIIMIRTITIIKAGMYSNND